MNTDKLRKERRQLEGRLAELIAPEIQKFREKTGICVNSIYVDFDEVTNLVQKEPEFTVGNVECGIAT